MLSRITCVEQLWLTLSYQSSLVSKWRAFVIIIKYLTLRYHSYYTWGFFQFKYYNFFINKGIYICLLSLYFLMFDVQLKKNLLHFYAIFLHSIYMVSTW